MTVHGHADPAFASVREIFEQQFATNQHVGASVAAYVRGELVVNLWGGTRDDQGTQPWTEETMTPTFSTTKGLTATCAHVLADRGLLDYDAPVAKYWPEFAQNGKEKITVFHLLTHQAGLAPMPDSLHGRDILDWDRVVSAIAKEAPVWEPGAESGYHAITFGFLVGEVVRRIDGRSVGTFLREEITQPLGITKLYLGAPASEEPNIAPLYNKTNMTPEQEAQMRNFFQGESLTGRAMGGRMFSEEENFNDILNTPEGHAAEIPSANGVACGRDLARFYACLANYGELDGVRILSEATVRKMSAEQTRRPDKIIMIPIGWAMGFMTGSPGWPQGPRVTSFGHAGLGGSFGFADPEIGMSFGFVPNGLTLDLVGAMRGGQLAEAIRKVVENA